MIVAELLSTIRNSFNVLEITNNFRTLKRYKPYLEQVEDDYV